MNLRMAKIGCVNYARFPKSGPILSHMLLYLNIGFAGFVLIISRDMFVLL